MNFAYCICPSAATSPLGDFDEIAMRAITKKAKIIMDDCNLLMENYSRNLSKHNAESFGVFEKIIQKHKDKIIKSYFKPDGNFNPDDDLGPVQMVEITTNAKTTRAKGIICNDESEYSSLEETIFHNRISVITTQDDLCSDYPGYRAHIYNHRLTEHLSFCLRSLHSRSIFNQASEDDCNDQIRDLMSSNGYLIKDQTRRGVSDKGYAAGEVDLLVECGKEPYAIIEGLIVDSNKSDYIKRHITKALTKYDSVGLRDFYILVYYRGGNFSAFSKKYQTLVSNFKEISGNNTSPVTIYSTSQSEIRNSGYREFVCLGHRRDIQITCTHMLIDQGQ
ncbi:hypothetical protein ACW5XE_12550 [Aeromonas caviae]|uniref:hypothetical protein n=1 Tax=Aeromonas caviae TaxID=648 RepID=UPI002B4A2DAA|nr:hypothetical protein [Aeromonas caviae]